MKRLISAAVSIIMLLTSFNFAFAENEPITGGVSDDTYTFNIGSTETSTAGVYDYSDDYFSLRVGLGNGDSITAADGIYWSNPSCKETSDTSGYQNASETGRYILIKPTYSGTLSVKLSFPSAGMSAKGRIWINDFSDTELDSVDLTTLYKGAGTQLGSDFSSSSAQTVTFDAEAGHTYSLHTYNRGSYITKLSYLITDESAPEVTEAPTAVPTEKPTYTGAKTVEYLDRGLVAVKNDDGVFLSWRLLGMESTDTMFDIYKNGDLLKESCSLTNYTDTDGTSADTYKVTIFGADADNEKSVTVWDKNYTDIPIQKPTPDPSDTKVGTDYYYRANDASAADIDGDGEYEIILKWDPSNSQDNYYSGYTGKTYMDAYETDGTLLWRIDMGVNIRSGAHYTQFIAYDFDSDGKAEIAMRTAPGTKDGKGNYVTEAGENLLECDNEKDYRDTDGRIKTAPDYLTIFNGETGEAMQTIDYFAQREGLDSASAWGGAGGDASSNYADRMLAGVAYVNGETPSLIMCRGYYYRAAVAAYDWDGENLSLIWERDDKKEGENSLYAQGAHSLSAADVDNDGYDEIIYGAATIDNDGSILNNTQLKHGDALHASDFDNDGRQEICMAHEHSYRTTGIEYHDGETGEIFAYNNSTEDVGRGVMDNIIASNPYSEFWSSSTTNNKLYDLEGTAIADKRPDECNFTIWWDGDLTREVLDATHITKYDVEDGKLVTKNRWDLFGVHSNNGTKQTPALTADLFGDWREEAVYATNDDNYLRVYTTDIPSDYKITTLMHDTQYRCAIAWQNVGYNQPPHTSFYIGDEKTEYPQPNVKTAIDAPLTTSSDTDITVAFTISGGAGAEITVGDKAVTADENGAANISAKSGDLYEVRKQGYKTASGAISENTVNVTLETGNSGDVTAVYKDKDANVLKSEIIGTAEENESVTVPETALADITVGGTVYEFDPDATDNITERVDGDDKHIDLVYKKKVAPVDGDTDITRINLGKNGFNKGAVSPQTVEYEQTLGGIKFGMFTGDVNANLNESLNESFYLEYDLLIPENNIGGTITVTPYSGSTAGTPLTLASDGESITAKIGDADCTYVSESYKKAGYWYSEPIHVTISRDADETRMIIFNRENHMVYAGYDTFDLGIDGIDRLVFSFGNNTVGIGGIEGYTVGGATDAVYPFGSKINMTAPSEKSIAPISAEHGGKYDSDILYLENTNSFTTKHIDLTKGLTYSLTETDGTETTDASVSGSGVITIGENAAKRTINANIMYNGHVFKTVPVTIVPGTVKDFWTEDFEGDTHKFSLSYSNESAAEFWTADPSKANAKSGKIYGVGARSGGATGTSSSEIDTNGYSDISIDMDFKLDATAYEATSVISLLGEKCAKDSLSSDSQILTIKALAGGGNGYWSDISINGKTFISKLDDADDGTETAGAGYDSGTKTIKFHALDRDSTGWMHLAAVPDFEEQTVNVKITKISSGETIYAGVLDFINEVKSLKYIFVSGGKSYGTAWIDDIAISGINTSEVPEPTNPPSVNPTDAPGPSTEPEPSVSPTQKPDNNDHASLIDTASVWYDGEVKTSLHNASSGSEPYTEYYQKNKKPDASNGGGFAFSQFSLSEEQLASTIKTAKVLLYSSGDAPTLKYKTGESAYTSAGDLAKYASVGYIEDGTGGFKHMGAFTATGNTVDIDGVSFKEYSYDVTELVKSMQSNAKADLTIAVCNSNASSPQKMLSYGSEYAPQLTLEYVSADNVQTEISGADGLPIVSGNYNYQYSFSTDSGLAPVWSITGAAGVTVDVDTGIVTVSENASEGTVTLTAAITVGGAIVKTEKEIVIEKPQPTDFDIVGTTALNLGETRRYGIENAVDRFGNDITDYASVSYMSSDNEIISVNGDELTANKKDTADITVTVSVGEKSKAKNITVSCDVYYITLNVSSAAAAVDISSMAKSENIIGYRVVTVDSDGNIIKDYTAQPQADLITVERVGDGSLKSVSVKTVTTDDEIPTIDNSTTYLWNSISDMKPVSEPSDIVIDTSGAARAEVSPIYEYEFDEGNCDNDTVLADAFAVSDYDIEVTRADHIKRDVYVNGYMIRNDFGDVGAGRVKTDADLVYTAHDVLVDTGSIVINSSKYNNDAYKDNADLKKAVIKKSPSIAERNKKVYIIGDSLVAEYSGALTEPLYGNNRTGWGQVLDNYFNDDIDTYNLAQSGDYAARLMVTAFPSIMHMAHEGDYLIIESGWNDVRLSSKAEMKASVIAMAEACEEKGVHPVLVSPNASNSNWTTNVQYASVMYEAAQELMARYSDVIFVNLASRSYNYLNELYGGDKSKALANFNLPITGGDTLHSSYLAAMKFAEIVAQGMADAGVDFVNKEFSWSCTDGEGNEIVTQVK